MNLWPNAPLAESRTGRQGRRIVFAETSPSGTMPALDYLLNRDTASTDPRRPLTAGERERFQGLFRVAAQDGPQALNEKQFKPFVGEDARDHMCEFRVGSHMGRRVLAFSTNLDGQPTIVLATGFNKPNQEDTPAREKARARDVLSQFLNSRQRRT